MEPDSQSERFAKTGAAVIERIVPPHVATYLASVMSVMHGAGRLKHDKTQVHGAFSVFGDPAFDTLLPLLAKRMAQVVGVDLLPTYSFARTYLEGQELTRHSDRPECQYSVTVHLGSSDDKPWPVELSDLTGAHQVVNLRPGDGLAYLGCELDHWRTPCPSKWYSQAFLHYVDESRSNRIYDGRAALGLPPVRKARAGNGRSIPTAIRETV